MDFSDKRILITGGTGFLGSQLSASPGECVNVTRDAVAR